MIQVALANEQSLLDVDAIALERAVRAVFEDAALTQATISLAVVDDPTIQALHRRYLQLDTPTDVLSFLLEQTDRGLEGEVIVSAETALRTAPHYDWPAHHELMLYAIHGALHLVGYDDLDPEDRQSMRTAEQRILAQCGIGSRPAQALPAAADSDSSAAAASCGTSLSKGRKPPQSHRGARSQ